MENEFCAWLTYKNEEWEFDLIGQYTLSELATETARPVPANVETYSYPRRRIIKKPLPYNLETNTFPLMKLESTTVSLPIMGLAADIQVSIDAYMGTESEYGEEWQDAFNLGMSNFMMELQDKAENGVLGFRGERAGLWDNDQVPAQNAPFVLDPANPPVTPEEGARFLAFLDDMATSVSIASRNRFKADTIVIPSELQRYFNRSIPQYGNMAGTNATNYLKQTYNIDVKISYNARRYEGGQILVYQRDQVRYFMAQPVEVLTDDKVVIRSGNNLYYPIRGRFSGVDFRQPLAGQYWNHVLTAPTTRNAKSKNLIQEEALTPSEKRARTLALKKEEAQRLEEEVRKNLEKENSVDQSQEQNLEKENSVEGEA